MSTWNYVVTGHKPTSVSHSCVGHFTGPNQLNLIVAKCTRIEIHLLTPQGLQPMLDVPIYGRIATIELFRPINEAQDFLFIATERYKFCVLQWDAAKSELLTRSMGDVSDRIGRPTDNGQVIPFDNKGQLKEAFNIRLEELLVLDIKFLYGCLRPTIVVLYQILLATGGGHLVYLEIRDAKLVEVKHAQFEHEISCVDLNPVAENAQYSSLAAIGLWTDISVSIYSLPDLELIRKESYAPWKGYVA